MYFFVKGLIQNHVVRVILNDSKLSVGSFSASTYCDHEHHCSAHIVLFLHLQLNKISRYLIAQVIFGVSLPLRDLKQEFVW